MNPRARCSREWPANPVAIFLSGLLLTIGARSHAQATNQALTAGSGAYAGDSGAITISPGFCATVFADKLGHARHLVVAANGVVYANTWSGRYYHDDTPPPGGFLIALQDTKGDGRADKIVRFGPTKADGNKGGTGIALYKGYVYAETNDGIVRYALPSNGIEPTAAPETVVSGLPLTGDHPMHPIAIDPQGNLRRPGICHEFVPKPESHADCAGQQSLHGIGNPRRHLALRCQPAGPAFLARRALRHRSAQWRGGVLRFGGQDFSDPAWSRPTRAELAQALHIEADRQPAGRGAGRTAATPRFRLAYSDEPRSGCN